MSKPTCLFVAEKFWSLRNLGICPPVALKLAVTAFISLYFQTFWPKWHNFFRSFQTHFGLWPNKKTEIDTIFHRTT